MNDNSDTGYDAAHDGSAADRFSELLEHAHLIKEQPLERRAASFENIYSLLVDELQKSDEQ